jgi:hypothetical protein
VVVTSVFAVDGGAGVVVVGAGVVVEGAGVVLGVVVGGGVGQLVIPKNRQ